MPRPFAVNNKCFPMAAKMAISLALVLLIALALSTKSQAQGPALTTISGVRYTDDGWGDSYSGNLVGRFTSRSFALTRFARAQAYFLRSYDGSVPPRYSRYSTKLYVDYPL